MAYGTYKNKSLAVGGGGRFAEMVDALKANGKNTASAGAIAASAGRKKFGQAKFAAMGAAGRKRAATKRNEPDIGSAIMR